MSCKNRPRPKNQTELISGEPDTGRLVSPVRRRVLGNLPAYTTEESEKTEVYRLAEKLGGDIEGAIRQLAERRREERKG